MASLTHAQRELLDDKLDVWRRAANDGRKEWRDYNRRCAEALEAALAIVDAARDRQP